MQTNRITYKGYYIIAQSVSCSHDVLFHFSCILEDQTHKILGYAGGLHYS